MSAVPLRQPPPSATLASINGPALLYVNAKWCPHCKATAPVMQEASCVLGSVVPVYDVDSERNKKLISQLGVQGFPTIIYMDASGNRAEFKGDRTQDGVTSFVCHKAACPGDMAERRAKCRPR